MLSGRIRIHAWEYIKVHGAFDTSHVYPVIKEGKIVAFLWQFIFWKRKKILLSISYAFT